MKQHGIGVGAVFDTPYHGRSLITEVRWHTISCLTQQWNENDKANFMFTTLKSMATGRDRSRAIEFPTFANGKHGIAGEEGTFSDFKMVVPASPRFIEANVPDGWLSGETDLDHYFLLKNKKT